MVLATKDKRSIVIYDEDFQVSHNISIRLISVMIRVFQHGCSNFLVLTMIVHEAEINSFFFFNKSIKVEFAYILCFPNMNWLRETYAAFSKWQDKRPCHWLIFVQHPNGGVN